MAAPAGTEQLKRMAGNFPTPLSAVGRNSYNGAHIERCPLRIRICTFGFVMLANELVKYRKIFPQGQTAAIISRQQPSLT